MDIRRTKIYVLWRKRHIKERIEHTIEKHIFVFDSITG
jgi:hypothetical protein